MKTKTYKEKTKILEKFCNFIVGLMLFLLASANLYLFSFMSMAYYESNLSNNIIYNFLVLLGINIFIYCCFFFIMISKK